MTKRTLAIVIAVIAVCAIAIVFIVREERGTISYPKLYVDPISKTVKDIDLVNAVSFKHKQQTLRINRTSNGVWEVAEKNNFPADVVKIRKLFTALIEAQKIEQKSSRPEDYVRLGVADSNADDGAGTLLGLTEPEKQWEIVLGKTPQHLNQGQYVRIPESGESWLINRRIDTDLTVNSWLDKQIIHIDPEQLHKIEVVRDGQDALAIVRDQKSGKLELINLSDDRQLKSDFVLQQLASVVDYLSFKEVFVKDDNFVLPKQHIHATFTAFDGLEFTMRVYQVHEDAYALLEVNYDEKVAEKFATNEEAKEDILILNDYRSQLYSDWYYQLLTPTYDALDVNLDDLTTEKEKSE